MRLGRREPLNVEACGHVKGEFCQQLSDQGSEFESVSRETVSVDDAGAFRVLAEDEVRVPCHVVEADLGAHHFSSS